MKISSSFLLIMLLMSFAALSQQHDLNKSVMLHADIVLNPPSIQIHWQKPHKVQSTQVFRKKAESIDWGEPIASLKGNATQYTDKNVIRGESYEYKVWQQSKHGSAYGYMFSAIGKPVVHFRGKLILLIDNTVTLPLKYELNRYRQDLEGDGWQVIKIEIGRNLPVDKVKQRIRSAYLSDPENTKALILFGHIPVPYSGDINPDRHYDHRGAWPADTYYADMDGEWTDLKVNKIVAKDPRHHNIPNDGKFDQNLTPSPPELQTGRIDFSNLTDFAQSEVELLRAYLEKNHQFRHKQFEPEATGLIENNFESFKEGFAQNGWKNFSPLVGPDNITDGDYSEDLKHKSFLWSYGCGAGSYTSCKGIINSRQFAQSSFQSVFNLLFGSYFGDWDSEDNLLRSSLASGTILTACWAGRPNWQFHHMSLGNPIGYSVVLSQKNHQLYNPGFGARNIHMGLLGDPTLRMKMVSPPENIQSIIENEYIKLDWDAPNDEIVGYHVYRKRSRAGSYELLTPHLITTTDYTESCLPKGEYFYMIRAIKLETSPSGSYYNLSQGSFSEGVKIKRNNEISPGVDFSVDGKQVTFSNYSSNASQFHWSFGDGTTSILKDPVYEYAAYDTYLVELEAKNSCATEVYSLELNLSKASGEKEEKMSGFNIFPNPTSEYLNIHIYSNAESNYKIMVFDLETQLLKENEVVFQGNSTLHALDIRDLAKGVYIIQVFDLLGKIGAKKFVVN